MNSCEYYEKLLKKWFPFVYWEPMSDLLSKDINFYIKNNIECICWYNNNTKTLNIQDISDVINDIIKTLIKLYE